MSAASLLRAARTASGMTQAEFADAVGVQQPVISAYENGRREPSVTTLERLVAGSGQRLRIDLVWSAGDLPPAHGDVEHGERLLQVLSLADAIPRPRTGALLMPRMVSVR
jgi:transcriptional regulator with XRE-family HTH domain